MKVRALVDNTRMYWLHAITPLHVGAGRGVGFIDMPIMRERVTNWPLVPGSAIKGVMRDHFTNNDIDEKLIDVAFGKKVMDDSAIAGALVLTDAHIVCMPVRSLYGTFAYATSPIVLERLRRDLKATGLDNNLEAPSLEDTEVSVSSDDSKLVNGDRVFLEDLDFSATSDDNTKNWATFLAEMLFPGDNTWQDIFKERFAVLSDDCFTFLAETGTEVAARIRIDDETKTVADKALWYEEALPAEAILAGLTWCDRVYKGYTQERILEAFCPEKGLVLQIGGKATIGRGRVRCLFNGGSENGQ